MVLPPASHKHLPEALWPLMLSDSSPIRDLFPASFETDGEGTRQDWEAVVLLPFIEKQRLLAAYDSVPAENFKAGELQRNHRGEMFVFEHAPGSQETDFCTSTVASYAGDVTAAESRCTRKPPAPALAPSQPGFEPAIMQVLRLCVCMHASWFE